MASYQEEIAAWRMQRQQQEIVDRAQQVQQEYAIAARERDEAIARNDMEEATYRDNECMDLEKEYNQIVPPQPPQLHPKIANLAQRNAGYFQKFGQRGAQIADRVHRYVTERMRVSPDDPRYEEMVKSAMEMYAKDYGCPYDPNSEILTADEAAKISGLSPKQYNNASRHMAAQGRFSWQNRR
jgi:hypothetical protein